MQRDFTFQKRAILIVLGLLLAADLGLAFYSWQLASSPHTPQAEFDAQNLKLKLLRGDIKSAQYIKDNMPGTRKDCEKFEASLPPETTGYSLITSEFDEIAKKAGLQNVIFAAKQKELPTRGMDEVSLNVTISGDYGSVVRFVNGLQRSPRFYVVDGLAIASDTQNQAASGTIKVGLSVRTYFRSAA
ncbi:MAG: type 4a pilus biogenesis protein PilO [Candidatus Acidiferrum sp.]